MGEQDGTGETVPYAHGVSSEDVAGETPNLSLVVAVASSPVSGIVLSRIVQGAGLRAVHCTTERGAETIHDHAACVVIVEEDAGEPEGRILRLAMEKRDRSHTRLPFVVSLSRSVESRDTHEAAGVDAAIAMPIRPDTLAPEILRLVEQARRNAVS